VCSKKTYQPCMQQLVRHSLNVSTLHIQAGMKAREQALYAALDDMESWLATGTVTNLCKLQNPAAWSCDSSLYQYFTHIRRLTETV